MGPPKRDDRLNSDIYFSLAQFQPRLVGEKLVLSGIYSRALEGPTLRAFPVVQLLVSHKLGKGEPMAESFFLTDALLTPVRAVTGLFRYLTCLRDNPLQDGFESLCLAVFCFALCSSRLDRPEEAEIGPLSAIEHTRLSWIDRRSLTSTPRRPHRMRSLILGQWTILLEISSQMGRTSYKQGFVLPKKRIAPSPSDVDVADFDVLDVKGFLGKKLLDGVSQVALKDLVDSLI